MTRRRITTILACLLVATFCAPPIFGQEIVVKGRFVEKGFPVDGGVHVAREGQSLVLVIEADFVTKPGPDLAIYLVPRAVAELGNRDATRDAVRVGELRDARGTQRYPLPADVDVRRYRAVILHSQTFSKLWGGADLR